VTAFDFRATSEYYFYGTDSRRTAHQKSKFVFGGTQQGFEVKLGVGRVSTSGTGIPEITG
jgi:hypothetical protein